MPGRYQFSLPERPEHDGWFRVGSLDVTTTALLVMLGVGSMFIYALGGQYGFFDELVYYAPLVKDGEVWRVVTWPIANAPSQIWVLITFIFFWFIGHRVEDRLGRKRFTILLALMAILPASAVAFFGLNPETGYAAGLGVLAISLLVIFAFDSPGAVSFFGIPAWVVAVAIVGIDILSLMGQRWYGMLFIEVGAIIVGAITVRQWGMLEEMSFIPRFGQRGGSTTKRSRRAKGRPTVVEGPWPSTAPTMGGLSSIEQIELDQLLDKTSAMGLDALSKSEKSRLNELSKKLRDS